MDKATIRKILADFPDCARQWHPTKNGDITPDQIAAGVGDSKSISLLSWPPGPPGWKTRVHGKLGQTYSNGMVYGVG